MKLSKLLKILQEMPKDPDVEFLTAIGQNGKVTGASIEFRPKSRKPYVRIDVVESERSFNTDFI